MKVRPSEIVGLDLEDTFTCFCFDRAITAFGDALMAELRGVESKTKREHETKTKRILAKWLPEASRAGRPHRDTAKRSG